MSKKLKVTIVNYRCGAGWQVTYDGYRVTGGLLLKGWSLEQTIKVALNILNTPDSRRWVFEAPRITDADS